MLLGPVRTILHAAAVCSTGFTVRRVLLWQRHFQRTQYSNSAIFSGCPLCFCVPPTAHAFDTAKHARSHRHRQSLWSPIEKCKIASPKPIRKKLVHE